MEEYQHLVHETLAEGNYRQNRTNAGTIAVPHYQYSTSLTDGYPLLTTKKMDGFRWNSMVHELVWFLSGEPHIRNLREKTKIWNEWADDKGRLETAYGRFWRRFPIPDESVTYPGEAWPSNGGTRWDDNDNVNPDNWVNDDGTFDQIQYVLDMLDEDPHTRRMVVSAWHPANAALSKLPPCHYSFVVNVQGDGTLHTHLKQRSGDIALGVPFNIASYSLLAEVFAQYSGYPATSFAHSIDDAHIYCGTYERDEWYRNNLNELQERLRGLTPGDDEYLEVRDWLVETAPEERDGDEGKDHIPNLLTQLSRTPRSRPSIDVAANHPDDLTYDDVTLSDYNPHDGLQFSILE